MTAVELANLALLKLGISQEITTINDATAEAYAARKVYDHHLRAALRRFPWPFATKYAELYLVRGPFWNDDPDELTLVQAWTNGHAYTAGDVVRSASVNYYCILAHTAETGTNDPPNATYWSTDEDDAPEYANGDWRYAYRWPSDCLYARRLVDDQVGRTHSFTPIPWRQGRDENGLLIYTNRTGRGSDVLCELEYTMLDCTDLWSDDLFLDAFTWRLAYAMAPSLDRTQRSPKDCLELFEYAIAIAQTRANTEAQQEKPGQAEWIEDR